MHLTRPVHAACPALPVHRNESDGQLARPAGLPMRRRAGSTASGGVLNQVLEARRLSQADGAQGAGSHAAERLCASSLPAGGIFRRTIDEPVDGARPGCRDRDSVEAPVGGRLVELAWLRHSAAHTLPSHQDASRPPDADTGFTRSRGSQFCVRERESGQQVDIGIRGERAGHALGPRRAHRIPMGLGVSSWSFHAGR